MKVRIKKFLRWWQQQLDPDVLRDQRWMNELREAQLRKEIEAIVGLRLQDDHFRQRSGHA